MKNLLILAILLIFPFTVFAGRVNVAFEADSSVTDRQYVLDNTHSKLHDSQGTSWAKGSVSYPYEGGDYSVEVREIDGYAFTLSNECDGTANKDDTIYCDVLFSKQVVTQTPIVTETDVDDTPQAGIESITTKSGLTVDQVVSIITLLRAFGVDEETIGVVTLQLL